MQIDKKEIEEMVIRSIERQELDVDVDEEMKKILMERAHHGSDFWRLGDERIPLYDPRNAYLCIGSRGWGLSFDKDEAIATCRKNADSYKAKLFKVTPNTGVTGLGQLKWSIPPDVKDLEWFEAKEIDDDVRLQFEDNDDLNNLEDEVEELLWALRSHRRGEGDALGYAKMAYEDVEYIARKVLK